MAGVLYGVGVGPGDPELLTIKAARLLSACEVIAIPNAETNHCTAWNIALRAVPEIVHKEIIPVDVPMTKDIVKLNNAYHDGCEALAKALSAGKSIAFLNLGDPTLYGSYMEIHKRMCGMGYHAEIVSGIPSICAVASALGEPLGERSEPIHIFPGSYELRDLEKLDGTIILMKSASQLPAVKRQLSRMEENGTHFTSAVTNCGMSDQKIYLGIKDLPEDAGYFITIFVKRSADQNERTETEANG